MAKPKTYKEAGVDIMAVEEVLGQSQAAIESTYRSHVLSRSGTFAGMVDLKAVCQGIEDPVLIQTVRPRSFRISGSSPEREARLLVLSCLNDVYALRVQLEPVSFLNYLASAEINPNIQGLILETMAEVCREAGFAMVSGETAQMGGVYQPGGVELIGVMSSVVPKAEASQFPATSVVDLQPILEQYKDKEPVWVESIDGVGTKPKLSPEEPWSFLTDLANHCATDIMVHGASPKVFLALAKVGQEQDPHPVFYQGALESIGQRLNCKTQLYGSISDTWVYQPGQVDLVGYIGGVVEKDQIIDGSKIEPGHQILGLSSGGLMTNGYSLARELVEDMDLDILRAELGNRSIRDALLVPHKDFSSAIREILATDLQVSGLAHITGGGLKDNILRLLPDGCQAVIELGSWPMPSIFPFLQSIGQIEEEEMLRVFNCGIGLAIIVPQGMVWPLKQILQTKGWQAHEIGRIQAGQKQVIFQGKLFG